MSQDKELPPADLTDEPSQPQSAEVSTPTTSKNSQTNPKKKVSNKEVSRQRPDPTFKRVIEKLVLAMSADSKATELKTKQITSPDLFVEIPLGTNTVGTVFDFFRQYTIIEFKSKNDPLTELKLMTQMGRVLYWLGDQKNIKYKQTLNVIVVAHLPPRLLNTLAQEWRLSFTKSRVGFYEAKSPPQDIVIVACDELPTEPKYAAWLLFADPSSDTWRKALLMMADYQMSELLAEAEKLYPKEYKKMDTEIEERLARLSPQEQKEYLEAFESLTLNRINRMRPEQRKKMLAMLPAEELIQAVPPEERLKGLPAEEIMRAVPAEQLGDALSKLPPEELAKILQKLQPPKQD